MRMGKLRGKLTYANVMSTIAVIVAVAGGTTAIAASVGKNSVTTKSIKPGNVTARDLAGIRIVIGETNVSGASCRSDEKLLGGGGRGTTPGGSEPAISESYPEGRSWILKGVRGNFQAYALCLKAKPGSN
jgi:hypothetical protein